MTGYLATGKIITRVSVGTREDVEVAAKAARTAYKERWGLRVPGAERSRLLHKFANLIEANTDRLAALEALNVGQLDAPHHAMVLLTPFARQDVLHGQNGRYTDYGLYSTVLRWMGRQDTGKEHSGMFIDNYSKSPLLTIFRQPLTRLVLLATNLLESL